MANEMIKKNNTEEKSTEVINKPYFVPRVDVQYDEKETVIYAEMPGVDDKSVDISLDDKNLIVTGYCQLQIPDGYSLKWQEYKIGNYRKSFLLNEKVETSKISAEMKNGILKIILPVKEKCKPVKIKVKAS